MNLSDDEKAKFTGGASGVGGVAASVAAVGATGTVTGFSAAGITSGLAAIVTLVGGGMAAGLAVTAAVPLACAGVGYLGYKCISEIKKKWL